jgi:hypothetical protein
MKTVTYTKLNGEKFTVEYDPDFPCLCCGLPVVNASMGGTLICPACDCGMHRDYRKWTYRETLEFGKRYRENVKRLQMEGF